MSKANFILLMLILLLELVSCSSSKNFNLKSEKYGIDEIAYLPPLSQISLIEKGNKSKYNDSLSYSSDTIQLSVINKRRDEMHLTSVINPIDRDMKRKLKKEIAQLCIDADRENDISKIILPVLIDSILQANNKRFGLITINVGFVRTDKNRNNQDLKAVGIAVVTLGMFVPLPISTNSIFYAMIVDSKKKSIICFRKNQGDNPLDEKNLQKKFNKMFKGFFWN